MQGKLQSKFDKLYTVIDKQKSEVVIQDVTGKVFRRNITFVKKVEHPDTSRNYSQESQSENAETLKRCPKRRRKEVEKFVVK